jgi:hypothetical protein
VLNLTPLQKTQHSNFLNYFNKYMPLATAEITAVQTDLSHKDTVAAISDSMDATVVGVQMADPEMGAMAQAAAMLAKLVLPLFVSLFHRNKAGVAFTADPTKAPPIPAVPPAAAVPLKA